MPQKITELQDQLEKIIKGKKEITDKILMAVLAKGHVLLEDVPGVGKTTPWQQNVRPNQMAGRQNVRPNQMPGQRTQSAGGAAMAGCRRPQPNQAENDILKRATENVSENDGDELEQQMMAGAHELVNAIDIDSASELMHEVEDLMIMGYQANLPFERDFIAEGVAMLNGYELDMGA